MRRLRSGKHSRLCSSARIRTFSITSSGASHRKAGSYRLSLRVSALPAIEPNPWFGGAAFLICGVCAVAALSYALPVAAALALSTLFLTCLCREAWRLGFCGRRYRVAALRCDSDGAWQVQCRGRWTAAVRGAESRIWRNVLWLRWETELGSVWTVLVRGQAPAVAWRQLQVRLRLPNAQKNMRDPYDAANSNNL